MGCHFGSPSKFLIPLPNLVAFYLGCQLWAPPIFFSFSRSCADPSHAGRAPPPRTLPPPPPRPRGRHAAGRPSRRPSPADATPPATLAAAAGPPASGPPPPRIRHRTRRRLLLAGRGRGEVAAVSVLQADAAAPRHLEPLRRRLGQVVVRYCSCAPLRFCASCSAPLLCLLIRDEVLSDYFLRPAQ